MILEPVRYEYWLMQIANGMEIVNTTLVTSFNCVLDLRYITNNSKDIVLYEEPFHRCIKKYGRLATLMLYKTGKLVCLAISYEIGRKFIRNFGRHVQKLGHPVRLAKIETVNIVATNNLKVILDLDRVDINFGRKSQYVKEIFPNLRYTSPTNRKHKVILASSGKYNLTGVTNEEQLTELERQFLGYISPIIKICAPEEFDPDENDWDEFK